jgi:hypothetical protein
MRERRDINLMVLSESRFGDVIMAALSGRIHYTQDDDFNDLLRYYHHQNPAPRPRLDLTVNG